VQSVRTDLPQYRLAASTHAAELDAQADELFLHGTQARANDDKCILSTMFVVGVGFVLSLPVV
jgi:hypothetical protein